MEHSTIKKMTRRQFVKLAVAVSAGAAAGLPILDVRAGETGAREKYPVVIIGGGMGGLTAGAYLARHGFPVTLLEQHDKPGGYATSFDRDGGRFTFEVSLHATSKGFIDRIMAELGAEGEVQTIKLPELARLMTKQGEIVMPQADPEGCIKAFVEKYPENEEGISGFIGDMLAIAKEGEKPFDQDSWWQKLIFPLTHRTMWNVRKKTLADMFDEHELSGPARNVLASWWGYYGLPPSMLSGFYYAIATGQMMRHPAGYIKKRSQDLSWSLAEVIEKNGGKVFLETAAKAISIKSDQVTGVTASDGTTYAARAVLSNASVPDTLKMLPREEVPKDYLGKISKYTASLSTFLVWLGLKEDITPRVPGYEYFFGADSDPEEDYRRAMACDAKETSLGITIYDNAYPGYSRTGTSTVCLIILSGYKPWKKFEADYLSGRKGAYNQQKDRIARILIERAEELLIPGLKELIQVKEAATPLTNLRYTRNPGGAIYGYNQTIDNAYMTRLKNKTPIRGLYFASAWGNPGGGYVGAMMGGRNCFRSLMHDWGFKVLSSS
ncbi:MAG: NAD(P)/FAD-dependent oxidoreductase [Deltaproteobacteria bacterium]|nr:NAD(P)/FAD-dependent oxidoreductase [Deltaproteobacteria bacterium]